MLQYAADQTWRASPPCFIIHLSAAILESNERHLRVGHAMTNLTGPLMRLRAALCRAQANPYFCAGRVTVPAVMDTFASTTFLKGCASCNIL